MRAPSTLPPAPGESRLHVVRVLHRFFRLATPLFLFVSFTFIVDETGNLWIMWRDAPQLAATLTFLSLMMAAAWFLTARRIRRATTEQEVHAAALPRAARDHPYNIWRHMEPRRRVSLAVAVFLIFASIGPLVTLMESSLEPVRPLQILIVTVASGAIAGSVILLGNRPLLLIVALLVCAAVERYATELTDVVAGAQTMSGVNPLHGTLTLTAQRQADMRAQRMLIGFGGILLIASGYVAFLILLAVEGRQRIRLQAEVTIAQRIQQTLLPSVGLSTSWCDITGMTVPAAEVGGDYFDYLELPDNRIAVVVADVAGHGVGAGILSAMTKSALRSQVTHSPAPAELLANLNHVMCQVVERNKFVTMAYILIDRTNQTARVATAGHPPVLHFRTGLGTCNELRTPSMALGMSRKADFKAVTVHYDPDDVFILFTDGVIEAVSPSGEQFGMRRLMAFSHERAETDARSLTTRVLGMVNDFGASKTPTDDATIVTVRMRQGA